MKKTISLTILLLVTLLATVLFAQESGQKLYRIRVKDFNLIKTIENKGVLVYNLDPGNFVEVLASPDQIRNLGIGEAQVEFIANSFTELYQNQPGFKTSPPFHNFQSTMNKLLEIATANPDITRLDTIGYSVSGRAICSLKISDNTDTDEDEPPILIVGNHHGNEVHSVEATLYQIDHLVNNYGSDNEITNWINSLEIWYVPMVNPDGREAMRRTNDHGVDLNRNYSFGFVPGGGHGPEAFSEPETRAIRDLAAQYPPIMSLSYHTSGQYLLHPWTHTDEAAPDSAAMIYLGTLISESITFDNNGRTGNYTLRQGGRWYFTAGEYCDYLYVTHNTMALTVEMGRSQSPDYSVIPEMVESNLKGMKTMFRQVWKAGITGLVTDAATGFPLTAAIDIPSIDNQGKLPPRLADKLFGRYYRYLEPGQYTFHITCPGYRTIVREITISPDSLTHLNIRMERAPTLHLGLVKLSDGKSGNTSGNGDGLINLGEVIGFSCALVNAEPIRTLGAYAKISSANPFIRFHTDSLYFGTIEGNSLQTSTDTVLFRIDPGCPDGEDLEFITSIGDSGGFGWFEKVHLEVYAPELAMVSIRIDDALGNQNGVFDTGEIVTIEVAVINNGRQGIRDLKAGITTTDTFFQVVSSQEVADQLDVGETHSFNFTATLNPGAPVAYFAEFAVDLNSAEGYFFAGTFQLNNIRGFFDDFESGANGWVHKSYGITSNNHDDWQLGTPAGKGRDPNNAFSGDNCWGTDLGWDSFEGTSWDGLYQANVYNFLRSPVIDCSNLSNVGLKFMRWLNIRINDHARIKVNEQVVWESPQAGIFDTKWNEQLVDISDIADNNQAVTITFEIETNSSTAMGGWNIDDVIVADGLASGSVSADFQAHRERPVLYDAYPSPFLTRTNITYNIAMADHVDLTIFDRSGTIIKTLISGYQSPGEHKVSWDGTDESGRTVPSGIYFYRLKTVNSAVTKSLVVIPVL